MADKKKPKAPRKKKPTGKRPGAQPGNKNSLKHGLWATRTKDAKKVTLELKKEIAWLGGVIERLAIKMDAVLATDVQLTEEERANLYAALTAVAARAGAMRAHVFLTGEDKQLDKEIEEGLFLARKDLGILDYLALPESVTGSTGKGSVPKS